MKKYVIILVVCSVSAAYATDYNPLADWVDAPGQPAAWSYGARIETGYGTGVFGNLILGTHEPGGPFLDRYVVPDTYETCQIGKSDPWLGYPGPVLNAWVTYQATARVTPESGFYDVTVSFIGTGYVNPSIQSTNVYVVKSGTHVLWQGQINDYVTPAGTTLTNIAFTTGDYLDFISGNNNTGESRTSLTAQLVRKGCTTQLPADLNWDCYINLEDFALFAAGWLDCNDPQNEACG